VLGAANDRRRVVLNVIIPEDQNIEESLASLQRIVKTDPRIINDDKTKPWIAVSEYTDTGVKLNVGVWTSRADFPDVQADLLRHIMQTAEHPNTGIVWDIYNMWSVTKEPPAQVYEKLKKYIQKLLQ